MSSAKVEDHDLTEAHGQEPQIYAVEKDLAGWEFSRRDLLAAAGADGSPA